MFVTSEGAFKGCRHHVQTMLNGFRGIGWIKDESDSGKLLSDFLPFVYTVDEDIQDFLDKRPRAIELGQFLAH